MLSGSSLELMAFLQVIAKPWTRNEGGSIVQADAPVTPRQ